MLTYYYVREICIIMSSFLTSGKLDLQPFELTIAPAKGKVHARFGFSTHF